MRLVDQIDNRVGPLWVQTRGWFVKEQDRRIHGQGPGDGHTLTLAAAEGCQVLAIGNAELVQQLSSLFFSISV